VLTQDAINELLVRLAREGRRVVRLKGGDPYLFGRGGEELRALRAAGVPCQVVPGVSSLSAVPAAAGIPVTDREFGTSVGAFSLHRRDGRNPDPAQWRSMAQGPDTLVLFMGLSVLPMACAELIRHGRAPELPAALVLRGTLPDQRTLVGTLATLPALLAAMQAETPGPLPGPGLIVVGEVVRLASAGPVLDLVAAEQPVASRAPIAAGQPDESATPLAALQPAESATPVAAEQPAESRTPIAAGPAQVPGLRGVDRPPVPPVACAAALPSPAPARPMIHQLLARPRSGADIEAGSFAVIDREAGAHGWAPDQWAVARRLVHTCADFGILEGLRFRHDAVAAGIRALRAGRPIYVDANMIRSGLSLARLRAVHPGYGPGDLHCHVADADVAEQAAESGLPRSLFALRKAAPLLEGAIVAIGNAPVALLELNRMIVEEGLRPALVVGMPVGFVHVLESKRELLALDVPAVVLEGRRGGSPLVVATLHALAGLAGEAL
jgi:precorrin isomerase/siroheme synthase